MKIYGSKTPGCFCKFGVTKIERIFMQEKNIFRFFLFEGSPHPTMIQTRKEIHICFHSTYLRAYRIIKDVLRWSSQTAKPFLYKNKKKLLCRVPLEHLSFVWASAIVTRSQELQALQKWYRGRFCHEIVIFFETYQMKKLSIFCNWCNMDGPLQTWGKIKKQIKLDQGNKRKNAGKYLLPG